MAQELGRLFLLPSPIAEGETGSISGEVISVLHRLDYFIVEKARTARRYISLTKPNRPIDVLHIAEMPENEIAEAEIRSSLSPLLEGHDVGILSEAGLPCIADPGNRYVALAHRIGITVIPLAGPSSIFLALMASGLEGQRFAFHGYLSAKKDELAKQLRDLEHRADRDQATQIFMETPYRNHQVLESAAQSLQAGRLFCIAAGLGTESGFVKTKTISGWKKEGWPELKKVPVVYLVR